MSPQTAKRAIEKAERALAVFRPNGSATKIEEPPHNTDLGSAQRFRLMHGANVRHSTQLGWLIWNGKRWARDTTQEIERLARETVRGIYREAADCPDKDARQSLAEWAAKCESVQKISAMLTLAESEPGIAVNADIFDRHEWLINLANGTFDVKAWKLWDHQRGDYLTKMMPVAFDDCSLCPMWEKFVLEITGENLELFRFLQKATGYSLIGSTRDQCFFLLYGTGSNGKSTYIKTISTMLGDYAGATPMESLLIKRGDAIRNDVARLAGLRFVSAVETEGGRRLAESLVKQLTGGDKMTARFLHHEFFEFDPAFKLWLAVNHKPKIVGTDNAIWRRVRLIPFEVTISDAEKDPDLAEKLKAELPGILNWALEGLQRWRREGLKEPDAVKAATRAYRSEMDVIGNFLEDCCDTDAEAEVNKAALYKAYAEWAHEAGERTVSKNDFGTAMLERGFTETRSKRERFWVGVTLLD